MIGPRYLWIAEAALKNRQKHFVIDGEAVVLGSTAIEILRVVFQKA